MARGPLLCTLLLGFGTAPLFAAEATYYDCIFPTVPDSAGSASALSPVMRFVLNTRKRRAFRIDTPAARRVEIFVSAKNEITLLDYRENREVSLVTIRHNGDSVFSLHRLSGASGEAGREPSGVPIGTQFFGQCFPVQNTAMLIDRP